jgi:hypothetical protein
MTPPTHLIFISVGKISDFSSPAQYLSEKERIRFAIEDSNLMAAETI